MGLGLRCFLAALGAAMATALACPPVTQCWLQWPGLVLVLRALDGLPARRAAVVGLCAGLGMQVALFTWLATSTARLGHLSPAVAALAFAAHSLFAAGQLALVGLLDAWVRALLPAWRRALFPCAYVTCELLWPKVIPWTIGLPQQHALLPIAQVAELGGAPLLSLLVVAGACGLDAALEAWRTGARRARVEAVVGVGLVLAGGLFGAVRLATLAPPSRTARVAIAQPGIVETPFAPHPPGAVQAALEEVARRVGRERDVALAVFPEAAAPFPLLELDDPPPGPPPAALPRLRAIQRANEEALVRLARLCRCPTLVGVNALRVRPGASLEDSPIVGRRNALALVEGDAGVVDRYDKHALLALAEHLPGEGALPWLRQVLPFAGRYTAGPGARALRAGDLAFAPLICFEAVPGEPARAALAAGEVDLLVNATNDVWFGGQGPHLHALAASLRAIETRRALVRSTTTGLSFFVLPDGTRRDELPPGEAAHVVRALPLPARGERTAHALVGSLAGWAAAMCLLVTLGLTAVRARIRR